MNKDLVVAIAQAGLVTGIKYHHGAAISNTSGRVVGRGRNHRISFKEKPTVHAEISALLKARGLSVGSTLTVVRVNVKTGKLGNSKPCTHCMQSIIEAGITSINYSNAQGEVVHEYI